MYLAQGWAVPAFNYWDEEGEAHMLLPVNSKYSGGESAPVEIGGQTPVLTRNALDDLDLAATLPGPGRYIPDWSGKNLNDRRERL